MRIVLSRISEIELLEIWNHNAERYGIDHADTYEAFLVAEIRTLIVDPEAETAIEGFPGRLALTIRRSSRGHGHIAVYRVEGDTIRVLHVFHTAQDITGRMAQE